eukprot:m.122914 g.122914  ORF g.122914 m.122914 type:complete len:964 (+) comp14435_c0_seq12:255-3146(+)
MEDGTLSPDSIRHKRSTFNQQYELENTNTLDASSSGNECSDDGYAPDATSTPYGDTCVFQRKRVKRGKRRREGTQSNQSPLNSSPRRRFQFDDDASPFPVDSQAEESDIQRGSSIMTTQDERESMMTRFTNALSFRRKRPEEREELLPGAPPKAPFHSGESGIVLTLHRAFDTHVPKPQRDREGKKVFDPSCKVTLYNELGKRVYEYDFGAVSQTRHPVWEKQIFIPYKTSGKFEGFAGVLRFKLQCETYLRKQYLGELRIDLSQFPKDKSLSLEEHLRELRDNPVDKLTGSLGHLLFSFTLQTGRYKDKSGLRTPLKSLKHGTKILGSKIRRLHPLLQLATEYELKVPNWKHACGNASILSVEILRLCVPDEMLPNSPDDSDDGESMERRRYVRLRVLDGLKTKHMRSSTVTGGKWTEWMERAEFLIESSNPILEVYVGEQAHRHFGVLFNADANTLDGSDKCIGSIKIPIYDKKAFPSDTTCRNQHLLIPPGPESDAATAYAVALGMKLELSITISSIGDEPLSHKSPIIQNNAWQLFPQVAGMLELEIIQATRLPAKDIDGTSDPYAVVQLGSTRLRTATKPGTLEPKWLKTFYIPVVDIFDTLEVSVFDEDPNGTKDFLGRIKIPLLSMPKLGNQPEYYTLKSKTMERTVKNGSALQIRLDLQVKWSNPLTYTQLFLPRTVPGMPPERKLTSKMVSKEATRLKHAVAEIRNFALKIDKLTSWGYGTVTGIATLVVCTWVFAFAATWMIVLLAAGATLAQRPLNQVAFLKGNLVPVVPPTEASSSESESDFSGNDEDWEDGDQKHETVLEKIRRAAAIRSKLKKSYQQLGMLRHSAEQVYVMLKEICDFYDRLKNLHCWRVEIITWVYFVALCAGALVLYLIGLNGVILLGIWMRMGLKGLHHFGIRPPKRPVSKGWPKKKPPILNFLGRIPSNEEIEECRIVRPDIVTAYTAHAVRPES